MNKLIKRISLGWDGGREGWDGGSEGWDEGR